MATIEKIFQKQDAKKFTENGDLSYNSTLNPLLDLLFMSEYYQKHLDEIEIGTSEKEKIFSMFIRDPRYGLGRRDMGRVLMGLSKVTIDDAVKAGRVDDIFEMPFDWRTVCDYLYNEIVAGNELVKKWMPRYSSKKKGRLLLARAFAEEWGMNKQQYGKFVKCNTTENKLSRKATDEIEFEHVPSLALIKYYKRFANGEDTSQRFAMYLDDVKNGKSKMNLSTTTVYDIFKNRDSIDAQLFFDKIEKISGSWIPIVDTSGSMHNGNDSIGKALSIGHYLAKCSTYAPNKVISFSSKPQLITLGIAPKKQPDWLDTDDYVYLGYCKNDYEREIMSMMTGGFTNTDFGAVMELLKEATEMPEYLIVLSDNEFDDGSLQSKDELRELWKQHNCNTKIIWWNLNSRAKTCPEIDEDGNIFISGYNPMLLKYLEAGFNGEQFLEKLLEEYKNKVL